MATIEIEASLDDFDMWDIFEHIENSYLDNREKEELKRISGGNKAEADLRKTKEFIDQVLEYLDQMDDQMSYNANYESFDRSKLNGHLHYLNVNYPTI